MNLNLQTLTIFQLKELLRHKQVSVSEITAASLDRIFQTDSKVHSFLTLNEQASADALKKDRQISQDSSILDRQPLFGIPLGIKDLYSTSGLRTTAGSKIIDNYVPQYSATVVNRYLKAGAIIVG
ncbi:MAG: aspartyl/glutamyl-tRNA amidotransferase subunit A, partial [uncultured bacterium]